MSTEATTTAAVYARVSTTEQARPQATSILQQVERGESYAKAHGWQVTGIYTDPGHSGNSNLHERPGGADLLASVRRGEADVVIFWSMDRFTRSASKGLADIEALEARGITVVFVKEAIDTSTPSGRLFRTMLAAFAEFEREQIRDRNLRGRIAKARKGEWPGGMLPFGYTSAPEGPGLVIVEPEADVVRRVFRLRAAGVSGPAVAETLGAEGVAPPNVARGQTRKRGPAAWTSSTVMRLLSAEYYRGTGVERTVGDEPFVFVAPAITTPKEWTAAHKPPQGLRKVEGVGERRYAYALSERLFHDHQGLIQVYADTSDRTGVTASEDEPGGPYLMFGQRRPSSDGPLRVYRCQTARKGSSGTPAICPGLGAGPWGNGGRVTAVQACLVEARVLLWMVDLLEDPTQLSAYFEARDEQPGSGSAAASLADSRNRVEVLSRQIEGIGDNYVVGAYGVVGSAEAKAMRASKMAPLAVQRDRLTLEIERLERVSGASAATLTVSELLAMKVAETTERDPNADEVPSVSAQGRDELRRVAVSVLMSDSDRVPTLSEEVVEEVGRLAAALDLRVVLTPNPSRPMWPNLRIEFGPEGLTRLLPSAC